MFFFDGFTNGGPTVVDELVAILGRYASRPFLSVGTVYGS